MTTPPGTGRLWLGAVLMITAMFVLSVLDVMAKSLSQDMHPFMVVWARYTSQTVLSFIVLAPILHRVMRTPHIGLQVVRSGFLFAATLSFFTALSLMGLAAATAVFQLAPLLISVLAFFVLGEAVGRRRWIGVGVGILGALIIIRPGMEVFSLASLLPALAALFFAGYMVSTRFLGAGESPWTSFLYTALFGCVAASCVVPFFWQTPSGLDILKMAAMGAAGGIGHFCLIRALGEIEASLTAPFSYLSLVFNGMWGLLVFSEVPDAATITGGVVVVGAGLYVWWREQKEG